LLTVIIDILANSLKVELDAMKLEYLSKEEAVKYYQAAVQILNEAVLMYTHSFISNANVLGTDSCSQETRGCGESPEKSTAGTL
jgi:hypothetical protein